MKLRKRVGVILGSTIFCYSALIIGYQAGYYCGYDAGLLEGRFEDDLLYHWVMQHPGAGRQYRQPLHQRTLQVHTTRSVSRIAEPYRASHIMISRKNLDVRKTQGVKNIVDTIAFPLSPSP